MANQVQSLSKKLKVSADLIKSTLEQIGISADDEKAEKQLAFLFHNDSIEWYCDECNDRLDLQSGFSRSYRTYTCKKCGHKNLLDYRFVDWK